MVRLYGFFLGILLIFGSAWPAQAGIRAIVTLGKFYFGDSACVPGGQTRLCVDLLIEPVGQPVINVGRKGGNLGNLSGSTLCASALTFAVNTIAQTYPSIQPPIVGDEIALNCSSSP